MKREGSGLYCEWCGEELECPCTPKTAAEKVGTMEPTAGRLGDRTPAPTGVDRPEAVDAGSNPAPPAVPSEFSPCERVAILYANFGYWPEYEYDDLDMLKGWYCINVDCGQERGKPHLKGCPVGDYYDGKVSEVSE